MSVAIIDYGVGNLRSVEKAFHAGGVDAQVSSDEAVLRSAERLVLPGVGAFPRAMRNLRELGLDELVRERAAAEVPVLGICLGMQLLFERSEEVEPCEGLGLLAGEVRALDARGERLPHIGWNVVRFSRATRLNAALPEEAAFYHVHSYVVKPTDPSDALGTAAYGERFVSAVARDHVFGVQFHPEKSSRSGLKLLASFSAACGGTDAASQPTDDRDAA